MAWAIVKGANVTKYDAGGSGDDVISDGYIKAVEKIWIDSYTMAQTDTKTTIILARLTANRKITGIDLQIETTASQTSQTLALGYSTDAAIDAIIPANELAHNLTVTTVKLPGSIYGGTAVATTPEQTNLDSWQQVTGATNTSIALLLNNWTASSGTIKSIVRYT